MRSRLVPALAAVAAIACFVAGVVTWRMFSPARGPVTFPCPANSLGCGYALALAPHRLHPLRAELLWAASAALALVAVGTALLVNRRGSGRWPDTTPPGAST
jgi:hypothetical protein